ncbi:DUF7848 domain-containing protein [Streptomyces misionensis]
MSPRRLFRHVRWVFKLLTADQGYPLHYSAKCVVCGAEPSEGLLDPFAAESWAIAHAAKADFRGRHHTSFRMFQISDAAVIPHPDDLRSAGADWVLETVSK